MDLFFSNQGNLGVYTHGFFFFKPKRHRTTWTYTTDSPVEGQQEGQEKLEQLKVGPCYGIPLNL